MTAKKTSKNWPGSQPPTTREMQAANRRLLSAMKRHKAAKKTLAAAERDLREARYTVKTLIDLLTRSPISDVPVCGDCHEKLGSTATCMTCSAIRAEFTVEPKGV